MNATPSPVSGTPQPASEWTKAARPGLAVRPAGHPVRTPTVVAVIALSWLGLLVHNPAELTVQARLGPTTVVPTAVYLLLAAGWMSPARRVAAWPLLGLGGCTRSAAGFADPAADRTEPAPSRRVSRAW